MTADQKQHWNLLHQNNKVETNEPTDFAKEVVSLIPSSGKLLELGCGTGIDAYFFGQQGMIVTATDFSEIVIADNKEKYSSPNLVFQVMDMSKKLQFANNEFDVVYSRLSLHYFTDSVTKSIFKEINRVLKPRGYLCIIGKSVKDPLYGKGELVEKDVFERNGHIRHFFSEVYLEDLLRDLFAINSIASGTDNFYGKPSAFIKVIAQKK
jgi:ubiquinone/menaquinone biosynthesis C-methylase UbiE